MSTPSPSRHGPPSTDEVLAQWDEWSSRCTDRLFELDARVSAQGSDDDRLDLAAAFVARKAIVARIAAMRAAGAGGGAAGGGAAALATQPITDERGELVAADLPAAATLVDAIIGRIERHLAETDAREAEVVRLTAALARQLDEAEALSEVLGSHVKQLADLRARQQTTGGGAAALEPLVDEATSVLGALRAAEVERSRILAALPEVPDRLAALSEREAAVRATVADIRAKVSPVPKAAVPSVAALGPLPDHADLPWHAAREQLAPYLAKLDRVAAALDEIERRHREVLERRNELRGLLQAFRDKAGARRLAEDRRLEPRYRAARDLLWSAPCDVTVAEPLVAGYVAAVNALIAGEDAGGGPEVGDRAELGVSDEGEVG